MTTSIDLGSGPNPKNPFNADNVIGIDIEKLSSHVTTCELGYEPIPFANDYFEYCTAFDLLEHIPRSGGEKGRRSPFIYLMNEIWRILKPNGLFYAKTPAYPNSSTFSDPTHVNFITATTATYFGITIGRDGTPKQSPNFLLSKRYGFEGTFAILENSSDDQWGHQTWLMQKIG